MLGLSANAQVCIKCVGCVNDSDASEVYFHNGFVYSAGYTYISYRPLTCNYCQDLETRPPTFLFIKQPNYAFSAGDFIVDVSKTKQAKMQIAVVYFSQL